MNFRFIDKEFKRLNLIENYIDYEFEPVTKGGKGKRHIYFEDLKKDFVTELNTYGFSPFILKKFEEQKRDPNIMKFMRKDFNHGLTNYIRQQTDSRRKGDNMNNHLIKRLTWRIRKPSNLVKNRNLNKDFLRNKSPKKRPLTEVNVRHHKKVKEVNFLESDFLKKAFANFSELTKLKINNDEEEEKNKLKKSGNAFFSPKEIKNAEEGGPKAKTLETGLLKVTNKYKASKKKNDFFTAFNIDKNEEKNNLLSEFTRNFKEADLLGNFSKIQNLSKNKEFLSKIANMEGADKFFENFNESNPDQYMRRLSLMLNKDLEVKKINNNLKRKPKRYLTMRDKLLKKIDKEMFKPEDPNFFKLIDDAKNKVKMDQVKIIYKRPLKTEVGNNQKKKVRINEIKTNYKSPLKTEGIDQKNN